MRCSFFECPDAASVTRAVSMILLPGMKMGEHSVYFGEKKRLDFTAGLCPLHELEIKDMIGAMSFRDGDDVVVGTTRLSRLS